MTPRKDAAKLLPDPPAPDDGEAVKAPDADADTPKDAAPKKARGPRKGSTGRPPGRPRNTPKLADRLEGTIGGVGIAVATFDPFDGRAIIAGAPELATALDAWAAESPAVRRTIENFLSASAVSAVLIALAKIGLPIAAHHNLLPGDLAALGVGPLAGGAADVNGNGNGNDGPTATGD